MEHAWIGYSVGADSVYEISDARQMELFVAEIAENIKTRTQFTVTFTGK